MPAKGMQAVRSKLAKVFEDIAGPMTEQTLRKVMSIGGTYADALTPMATGTLLNGRFLKVDRMVDGWTGRYGYIAAYAAAVHDAPGTLKGRNVPRNPATLGNVWDNGYGANGAEPEFLRKGFERDGLDDIKATIKQGMKL